MDWPIAATIIVAVVGAIAIVLAKVISGTRSSGAPEHKFGERMARIETASEGLKDTAATVARALIEHDQKDDRVTLEIRNEMHEGFKGIHDKLDKTASELTKTVISALSGNKT